MRLSLKNIDLERGGLPVLQNFSWAVQEGEHWVVLGPNGSGKSSLMQLLQGRLWPQEGTIEVLGRQFGEEDLDSLRRSIGWVGVEVEGEFPSWQELEDVVVSGPVGTLGLKFDQPTEAQRKAARAALQLLGLDAWRKRPLAELSQGQRRLGAIARALSVEPGLLLLDEATGGLDPVARERFLLKIQDLLTRTSPGILYVTHHVEEILPGITHALLLKEGKPLAAGPLAKVMTSKLLSQVFGAPLQLLRSRGRYQLRLK
jgi:iron complex transport system ATP-binding protein